MLVDAGSFPVVDDELLPHRSEFQLENRELMLAVLEEALLEYEKGVGSPRAEDRMRFHEVDRWVSSEETDWPFAFENVCYLLMLDAGRIREQLARMKRQAFAQGQRPPGVSRRRRRIHRRATRTKAI